MTYNSGNICNVTISGSNTALMPQKHTQNKTDLKQERAFVLICRQIQREIGAIFIQTDEK